MTERARMAFIGGPHRSGTTMLASLLAHHPAVSGLVNTGVFMNEGQFLQDVYPADPALQPGFFALEEQAHLTELPPDRAGAAAERLRSSWAPYWERPDAALLVEKSPPNMLRSRFLDSVFPEALQIFLLRDPIVVALATQKWSYTSLTACVGHTVRSYRVLFEDLRAVSSPWLVVRYESLTAEPRPILSAILKAGGVDPAELPAAMLRGVQSSSNEQYLRTMEAPAFTAGRVRVFNRARQWLRSTGFEVASTERELAYVRKAFAHAIGQLGYGTDVGAPSMYAEIGELPDLRATW